VLSPGPKRLHKEGMKIKHSQSKTATGPSKSKFSVLRQICNLIPPFLVSKLARETGVDARARSYSPWSHVVTLLYAQLVHAIGLNDVCDSLRLHSGLLVGLRGATPPSRNNLSHANRERDAALAEKLFWAVLEHLRGLHPGFAGGRRGRGLARRFRRVISVVDSTTIQLVASCMDWAKHRRRKAAAKFHLRLDLHSFLPRFAIIDTARDNDAKRAREICADIRPGEIVLFDKAYVDFAHLWDLTLRGIFWVTRAKDNMVFDVIEQRPVQGAILRDEIVCLGRADAFADYPGELRRIVARVEVDGREQEMVFLTNNREWSAQTIADLYRCRWNIEVFFKQIKQTLQLADFLGHSANAVRWQVWMALLVYVLLRFLAVVHGWHHSFTRLFTLLRAALWRQWDLGSLLQLYGTARGAFGFIATPQQPCFEGI
jgi:Transposase DDE domain/Domain of unknown function (DUF4372)